MINLFKISPHDVSIQYLGKIFGSMSGIIVSPDIKFGDITILSTMFKVFNGVILTIAVLMLIYVTVVGVVATAHDGEFMGKKWHNNIWIPLRAVLGFAMLVPTGAGYCGLQLLMMWVIVQGIGAADVLWNTALGYVDSVGSVYAQIKLPSIKPQTKLPLLFKGLTCDASTRFHGTSTNGPKDYFCQGRTGVACSATPEPTQLPGGTVFKLPLGPAGNCGTLIYDNQNVKCNGILHTPGSLACKAAQGQANSLRSIVPTLSAIAIALVQADYSYRDFYVNSGVAKTENPSWSWIYQYCADQGISRANCCVSSPLQTLSSQATGMAKICSGTYPPPDLSNTNKQSASTAAVKMYWQYYPSLGPALGQDTSFVQSAIDYYMDQAEGVYTSYFAERGNRLKGEMRTYQEGGWLTAGAYYSDIASKTGNDLDLAVPSLTWKGANLEDLAKYRNNWSTASKLLAQSDQDSGSSSKRRLSSNIRLKKLTLFSDVDNQLEVGDIDVAVNTGLEDASQNFGESGSNPLVHLATAGQIMLQAAFNTIVSVAAAVTIVGLLSFAFVIAGNGPTQNPIGGALETLMGWVMPFLYIVLGILISIGGLLGVYVPMVPMVIFAFGVIHWLISTVETMVAGPLVALGIINPQGEHELLGKSEAALMLLFNVFLRPSLMIFGYIAAMLLASVVADFIDASFGVVKKGLFEGGIFAMVIAMLAYTFLMIAALNKCFAVINLLPQQVMRWMGAPAGDSVDVPLEEVKKGTEQGAEYSKTGMKGLGEVAKKGNQVATEANKLAEKFNKNDTSAK